MGLPSLSAALSGLQAAQAQINVISNNVANASTPGHSRKILPQSSQVIDGLTVGVYPETIIRNVDINLERDLWTQVSAVNFYSIQTSYLNRVQDFHGPPDAELSVSAEIARLQDAFSALADSPEDQFLLAGAVDQAIDTADKINDLSNLILQLRNDAQDQLNESVDRANDLLSQIAAINSDIATSVNIGRTTASLADARDIAINELAGIIDISFYERGDGVMIVQTNQGYKLADTTVTELNFNPAPISSLSTSPARLYVGDPDANGFALVIDITEENPGGAIGGLLELRDVTFPKQMAQLDELAHKLALRTDQQGLRLFTDLSGNVPADTAPDPTTDPPTPVSYVGFSSLIQVNQNIIDDHTLLQKGTVDTDITLQPGSNEVIRRIAEFAFGDIAYEQATGTIDMRSLASGATTLQNWLGVSSSNEIIGGNTLSSFLNINDVIALSNGAIDPPTEEFQITFSETRDGLGPVTITINLTNVAAQPGANALEQIVAEIDAQITAAGLPAGLSADASIGSNGQLILESSGTIIIDGAFGPTGMQDSGLALLGLNSGTFEPEDPYFDVTVGNAQTVRVYIEPGDTEADLINKLILNTDGDTYNPVGDTTGIPGLAYDEATFNATGELILRPGDDFDNPSFGGDLNISSGPFDVDPSSAASPDIAALGAGNGVNIVSALFGSYSAGPPAQNVAAIQAISHASETDASLTPPIPTVIFRQDNLGINANISTRILASTNLVNFSQKLVNEQTQETVLLEGRSADEKNLQDILKTQLSNESGVNIDEELSHLIIVQTAYGASARMITAVQQMFDELLRIF